MKKEERERERERIGNANSRPSSDFFQAQVQAHCQLSMRGWVGLGSDLGFIYLNKFTKRQKLNSCSIKCVSYLTFKVSYILLYISCSIF